MNGGGQCLDPTSESKMCTMWRDEDCSLPCAARSGTIKNSIYD
jgi:hypothetical protein